MKKESDIENLEDIQITFGKHAFAPKVIYCGKCDIKMKKTSAEFLVSEDVKIRLNVFKCPKCKEDMLGLDESKKLDRALIISRLLSKDYSFGFRRRLSYDGDNYIFRLPSELTKGKHTEVKILPLESNEALIRW